MPALRRLTLIGLSTVQNLPVVVPIGLLLGVVLAFGRLWHESEMTAAQACGVGLARIYVPITGLALVVTACLAWLTLDLAPRAGMLMRCVTRRCARASSRRSCPGSFAASAAAGS